MFRPECWLQKRWWFFMHITTMHSLEEISIHFDLCFPKYIATLNSQFWLLHYFVLFFNNARIWSHTSISKMFVFFQNTNSFPQKKKKNKKRNHQTFLFQGGSWTNRIDETERPDWTWWRHAWIFRRLNRIGTTKRSYPNSVSQSRDFKWTERTKGESQSFVWILNEKIQACSVSLLDFFRKKIT